MRQKDPGFTLIELTVVIIIIGILAAAAMPAFSNMTTRANIAHMRGVLGAIRDGIKFFSAENVIKGVTPIYPQGVVQGSCVNLPTLTSYVTINGKPIAQSLYSSRITSTGYARAVAYTQPTMTNLELNNNGTCAYAYNQNTGQIWLAIPIGGSTDPLFAGANNW